MLGLFLELLFGIILGCDLIIRIGKLTDILFTYYKSKDLFQKLIFNEDTFMLLIDIAFLIIISFI